jgi:hypothetical protein
MITRPEAEMALVMHLIKRMADALNQQAVADTAATRILMEMEKLHAALQDDEAKAILASMMKAFVKI